jgi:hypothetical protein
MRKMSELIKNRNVEIFNANKTVFQDSDLDNSEPFGFGKE